MRRKRKRKSKSKMEEEEEKQKKTILEQVFGESSSDSDSDSDPDSGDSELEWKSIDEVKGLWLCTHFLSPHHQSLLLSSIESENWFSDHHPEINQAMRFGHQNLPPWAHTLSHSIRRSAPNQPTTATFSFQREPLFDQMIVNVYHPGEGIAAHVDLLRFDDGIAIVSLESSCVMHFTPLPEPDSRPEPVSVLLLPGSLVLMSGEARYRWQHEINRRPGFQSWQGRELSQTRRTSITLRKLCSSQ